MKNNRLKAILTTLATIILFYDSAVATIITQSIIIPASPLWTNTQIDVTQGQQISITASGTWSGFNNEWFGPDGVPDKTGYFDNFLISSNHCSLIAFIGSDPYQGHWGDSSFFPQATGYWSVGSSAYFTADKAGRIWLGFNDDAISGNYGEWDNLGYVEAVITPEPCTLALFGLGGLLLRRHKK